MTNWQYDTYRYRCMSKSDLQQEQELLTQKLKTCNVMLEIYDLLEKNRRVSLRRCNIDCSKAAPSIHEKMCDGDDAWIAALRTEANLLESDFEAATERLNKVLLKHAAEQDASKDNPDQLIAGFRIAEKGTFTING